jgi:hypothetical protein
LRYEKEQKQKKHYLRYVKEQKQKTHYLRYEKEQKQKKTLLALRKRTTTTNIVQYSYLTFMHRVCTCILT